jgi:hypothetical protein
MENTRRYIVINKNNGDRYMVTYGVQVGRILGVSRETIRRWFAKERVVEYDEWIVVRGYNVIKGRPGGFRK